MTDLKRAAILLDLAKHIAKRGSWSGETHMQKATYLLQSLAGEDLGYDFIMHMHGPFSYDLRDDLHSMSANGFLAMIPQGSYGPRLRTTELADKLISKLPKTIQKVKRRLEFVSEVIGAKDVRDLECLATALFVTKRAASSSSKKERANELLRLKPHISQEASLNSVKQIDELLKQASSLR